MNWKKNNVPNMKLLDKSIGKVIAISIILVGCFVACEKHADKRSGTTVRQVTETLLFEIPWGSEKGLVGFLPRTESYEDQGPTSLYVGNEGRLFYVLDTVNRRVNVYEKGKFLHEIKLVSGYYPFDVYATNTEIFILTDFEIIKFSHEGSLIKSKKIVSEGRPLKSAERMLKVSNTIIVLSRRDTSVGDFACFDLVSLESRSCESIREIYAYKVIDSDLDKIIAHKNGDLVYVKGKEIESIGPTPSIEEIYPPIRLFRVSSGNVYVMRPTEKGLSFYVQE